MPVQIFTSSPIHPSEADGPTPKTGEPGDTPDPRAAGQPAAAPATTTTTTTTSSTSTSNPPPAQPGARPSLPVQTAAPQAARRTNYQPTQTQPDPSSTNSSNSPPAPQPGAVPLPSSGPGQHHHAPPPPPPKAGAAPSSSSYSYAPSSAYTPRARYPQAPHDDNGHGHGHGGGGEARNYSHPPGYQQNVHAAEFSSAQLAAHNNQSVFRAGGFGADDDDGVWSTAKRWAAAAGESIMAAEEQIWKKINGD